MQCELSGESLANAAAGTVVVTPSGHVCRKALLLTKLTENGGLDPFHPERPLAEDDLITLATLSSSSDSKQLIPPRPLQATTLPALLQAVGAEYDAVLLELFDTRQALQDARQELSQALYQNDAAVRVIARLSAERDAARQELQAWQAQGGGDDDDGPAKKRKRDTNALADAAQNEIPEDDFNAMYAVWEPLHKGRKALMKSLGQKAPSTDSVKAFCQSSAKGKSWSKKSCAAAAVDGNQVVVATDAEAVQIYQDGKQVAAWKVEEMPAVMGILADEWVVWGNKAGNVQVAKIGGGNGNSVVAVNVDEAVTAVSLHQDKQHALVATQGGKVCLLRLLTGEAKVVSVFESSTPVQYTSGCLHPDGLIYLAGTSDGALLLWDLKSKSLAGSMHEGTVAVQAVQVSPNGYHIAAAYADGTVRVWDLRKQKVLATLTTKGSQVTSVTFDEAGKYVLYGGSGNSSITIVPVKEWENTMEIKGSKGLTFAGWSAECGIVGAGSKGLLCYGTPSS